METPLQGPVQNVRRTLALLAVLTLASPTLRAEDNTLTVIDGFTDFTNGPVTIGSTGTNNQLIIESGGQLIGQGGLSTGTIGLTNTASNNFALISGIGSVWSNVSELTIGYYGRSNTMVISDGGEVFSGSGHIGRRSVLNETGQHYASGNRVLVSGVGSKWETRGASGTLTVGFGGSNNWLLISDGGWVTNNSAVIYKALNGVSISGSGSRWGVRDELRIEEGELLIQQGAEVTAASLALGAQSSSGTSIVNRARIQVADPGSKVTISGSLTVGRVGAFHEVAVADGSGLFTESATIGQGSSVVSNASGQSNRLWITGSGTVWSNTGALRIGRRGSANELLISNGAAVFTLSADLGFELPVSNSRGADGNVAAISGSNATWTIMSNLTIGGVSQSNLVRVEGGAFVNSGNVIIGSNSAAHHNQAILDGWGSRWTASGSMYVGFLGAGSSLAVSDAAILNTIEGTVGWTNSSFGNLATVFGTGSTWSNSGALTIGLTASSNTLVISNGGRVYSGGGFISRSIGATASSRSSNNTVLVAGAGSLWDSGSELRIGLSGGGSNQFLILDGGRVTNGSSTINGRSNTVLVDGLGSRWDLSGSLHLNATAGVQVVVANAAQLTAGEIILGAANNSSRSDSHRLLVQGSNSSIAVSGALETGRGGAFHRVIVSNGASLSTGSAVIGSGTYNTSQRLAFLGDSNEVHLIGVGSVWTNQGKLRIGADGGTNYLIISNGARAVTGSAVIGARAPDSDYFFPSSGLQGSAGNAVVVTGLGSFWDGGSNLVIGLDGRNNRLEVLAGASVTNSGADIGGVFSGNRAVVSGAGATWDVSGQLWVGRHAGTQRLIVSNGATVRTEDAFIGNATFVTNSGQREVGGNQVVVGGSNATWTNAGTIVIGSTNELTGFVNPGGTNRLDIGPYGRVYTSHLVLSSKATTGSANSRQRIVVNGGELHVTNASGTGLLSLGVRSQLELFDGTVRADDFRSLHTANLLVVSNTLHVGGHPALLTGDMAVGRLESIGSAILGGLIVGGEAGSTGEARFSRPTLFASATNRSINAAGNALTVIGGHGQGLLVLSNVGLLANELSVGRHVTGHGHVVVIGSNASLRATAGIFVGSNGVTAGTGSIIVSNGATLRTETLLVGSNGTGGVTNYGGRFQFGTNAPVIEGPNIVGYDVTIDYTNVANAFLQRDQLPGVTNIQLFGAITYELSRSTNATPEFLELRTNSTSHYQRLSLRGNSLLQTAGLLLNPGTALASPTNGAGSVSGLVTNRGRFTGHSSTLTFLDAVEFGPGATVDGTNVTFAFRTNVLVRDSILTVTPGVTFETPGIALDNSTLVSSGALQFTNLSPSIPALGVLSSNGIFSFRNQIDVPLERTNDFTNIVVTGTLDFRLNNSTNAYVSNYVFQAANSPSAYTGLRLEGGTTRWQSGGLTIGPGGLLWVSNTTPAITISDATLRIEDGQVIHAVAGSYNVGYADVPGAATVVTGSNALWRQTGILHVGWTNGTQSLLVSNGAAVIISPLFTGGSLIIGGSSDSHGNTVVVSGADSRLTALAVSIGASNSIDNKLIVTGQGARLNATSITVGVSNSFNELLITDGGSVTSTSTFTVGDEGGSSNLVRIMGGGRLHTISNAATIGQEDIGNTRDAVANHVLVSGAASAWEHAGELRVGWGHSNSIRIEQGGRLSTGSAYVDYSGSSNLAVVRGIGSVWSNQTFIHVGNFGSNNQLRIEVGGRVISSNLVVSRNYNAANNGLILDGGYALLTNASGYGSLDIAPNFNSIISPQFTEDRLELKRGEIEIGQLRATNGLGRVIFSGGILSVSETTYRNTNGFGFIVGDATNAARLHLRGGTHTFNTGLTLSEHGALTGSGTVLASVTTRGTVAPGDSAGTLIFQSNLSLTASARMSFEIGGLLAGGQHDFVAVSNLVEFAGTLSLALLNGFTPAPADAFTLMTFGSGLGAFANAANGARVNTANNLGSFHVSYSGNALTVSAYQSTDTDADGIEDAWAVTYFGASPLANGTGPSEKFGDLDGDGQSNHAEFVAGTNPTDALDVFGVTELLPRADGAVRVRFRHLPGKTQRLWVSTNLASWTEVVGPWLSFPAVGTAEWLDDGVQVGVLPTDPVVSQRYYRVTVE